MPTDAAQPREGLPRTEPAQTLARRLLLVLAAGDIDTRAALLSRAAHPAEGEGADRPQRVCRRTDR